MRRITRRDLISIVLIVAVALVIIVAGNVASDPNSGINQWIIKSLDEKQEKVLALVGSSTGASFAVSLVPGDAGTAVAQELAQLASLFAIALGAIFLEKFLLVIFQEIVFKCLLPIVLVALVTFVVTKKKLALNIATKLFVFSLVLLTTIPVSEFFSAKVYSIYGATIDNTLADAESTTAALKDELDEEEEILLEEENSTSGKGLIGGISDAVSGAKEGISGAASAVVDGLTVGTDKFMEVLNNLLEALAIMLVTCCVLPIISLALIVLAAKYVLQIPINVTGTVNLARGKLQEQIGPKKERTERIGIDKKD